MKAYKVLVLTDHTNHSKENSLYPLVKTMNNHPMCSLVYVASRGIDKNEPFFNYRSSDKIWGNPVDDNFTFSEEGKSFYKNLMELYVVDFDLIWLRLPPPLDKPTIDFFHQVFEKQFIFNNPKAIYECGSKQFLLNFPELCAPMKACHTKADIITFKNRFPIVLKPFRDYGGKGIIRIDGDRAWVGHKEMTFQEFITSIPDNDLDLLGVKYLSNVSMGDKRIVVVDGQIIGASLRLPAKDSWICNVAMGGSSHLTQVEEEECDIIRQINPILSEKGILMYGVDTLVNDDGKRILSEINTTSIGGVPQMGALTGKPLVEETIDLILKNFKTRKRSW